jgi:protein-S-isoprenylcysteine O-methyltransferase Ste14
MRYPNLPADLTTCPGSAAERDVVLTANATNSAGDWPLSLGSGNLESLGDRFRKNVARQTLALLASLLVYWISAAQRTAPNRIPLAIGVFSTVFWWMPLFLRIPALWTQSPLAAGTGLAFTVAGLCFAVWARMHLGKYWSGRISLEEQHGVIQTGPYAWVRHPIYSGLILALFGTAITLGTILAFAGFAFMLISFVRKLKIEETWLRSQFGVEYEAYRNRVKALIPH